MRNPRGLKAVISIAALALAALPAFGPAPAAGAASKAAPQSAHESGDFDLDVNMTAHGFTVPHTIGAGWTTFHVYTSDPMGHQLQILRAHKGISRLQVASDLAAALSPVPPASAAGIRKLEADTDAYAGATVVPHRRVFFTEKLQSGTYYFVDFAWLFANRPLTPAKVARALHPVQVHGRAPEALELGRPSGTVIQFESAQGPRFSVHRVNENDNTYLVLNKAPLEFHEMQVQPVRSGTTDAELQADFNALLHGTKPPTDPFTGPPVGLGAISPGGHVAVQFRGLPGGTYALLCFLPDRNTGLPHAFEGMHKIVHLAS